MRCPFSDADSAAPGLLLALFAAATLMVGAVLVVAWSDSPWVDAGAIALLLVLTGALLVAMLRQLRDEDDANG